MCVTLSVSSRQFREDYSEVNGRCVGGTFAQVVFVQVAFLTLSRRPVKGSNYYYNTYQ